MLMENVYFLDQSVVDPYGAIDFMCKFCSDELSNVYMHCDGCEKLLQKDFNICPSCYENERYKNFHGMHPTFYEKELSTFNHTGDMAKRSRTSSTNKTKCIKCDHCSSCICHQKFTLNYRFMTKMDECELLKNAKDAVGMDMIPDSLETKVRLFSLLPGFRNVKIGAIGYTFAKEYKRRWYTCTVMNIRPGASES